MMVPRDKLFDVFVLLIHHDPEHRIGIKPMTHYHNYIDVYIKDSQNMNTMFYDGLARMICNAVIEGSGGKNLHLDSLKEGFKMATSY